MKKRTKILLFRLAAMQGNALAQFNLGLMYENGTGVAKNNAEAVKWLRKAAAQGDVDAHVSCRNAGGNIWH